jgi:alpha-1,6-mannosyltransferase
VKSLHITNAWHPASGGIGTFYRALMAAAGEHRHYLRMVVPSGESCVEDVTPYVRIYHLKAPLAPLNRSYRWLLPHRYLLPGSEIRRILQSERPDVVEICDKYTLQYLAGLIRRNWFFPDNHRPTLIGLSCERMVDNLLVYLPRFPLAEGFCRLYMKWLYFPLFDHHITVSQFTAAELREASRGHMVPRGVWVRGMGVDIEGFGAARRDPLLRRRLLARAGGGVRAYLLLYAGRLAPEKNLPLLVGMMERLALSPDFDFRLVIAGEGMLRKQLERAAAVSCPGRVAFIGHIGNRDELAAIYASADAFVHPNPAEPFGIAPLEALASGLPLIACNRGGLMSYASPANAWLADPDPRSFAAAALDLARSPAVAESRVEAGLETARRYDWPAIASEYLMLYREIHDWHSGVKLNPRIRPDFLSTSGNWLGQEMRGSA